MSEQNLRCFITNQFIASTLQPALPKLLAGTLFSSLSGLAMLVALWCLIQLLDDLSSSWVLSAVLLWVLGAIFAAAASWLAHDGEAAFSARLRRQVANHLVRLPATALAQQSDQSLRSLVSSDIEKLHHMVAHLPSEITNFVVLPITSILLLVNMVGLSALWVLLPGIFASLYYLIIVPHINARDGEARMKVMGEVISAVDDYARGIRVNRIYGRQSGALAAYDDSTQRFTSSMVMWVGKVATLAGVAVALLQAVATFAIAYLVAYDTSTTTLAATLFFSLAIVSPALRLGHGLDYVSTGRAALGRIITLLQQPRLPTGAITQLQHTPTLALNNAHVAIDGAQLLNELNYTFQPSALHAITGPSGIGKTTVLRTLAGLERLQAGQVLLAQTDITQLSELTRYQSVLLIPQGGDVLSATVAENLHLIAPEASTAQLKTALLSAQLSVDLEAQAKTLSGGERQRLGIARAFLSSASVILLDEPTSALDAEKATRLITELERLAREQEKTIVMVTHDKALAANATTQLELTRLTTTEDRL
jgi:ABC-type transport system involved in cytochrome bd biosynthesis fused ATPase/permease subunit